MEDPGNEVDSKLVPRVLSFPFPGNEVGHGVEDKRLFRFAYWQLINKGAFRCFQCAVEKKKALPWPSFHPYLAMI